MATRSQRHMLCSSRRPFEDTRKSVALLFRGAPFRWGCDDWGAHHQYEVAASYRNELGRAIYDADQIVFQYGSNPPWFSGALDNIKRDRTYLRKLPRRPAAAASHR